MTYPVPQDTPTKRATLSELPISEIEKLVESMRERRMRSYNAFELAQAAKAKMKLEKDKARYDHLLAMFEKKFKTADAAFECCSKYLNELKVLELVLGD